ncbi:hypothetical protein ES705_36408 [subsurface metagenome]
MSELLDFLVLLIQRRKDDKITFSTLTTITIEALNYLEERMAEETST